jgi:uncharacterized membrane protein
MPGQDLAHPSLVVQVHLVAALLALVLGGWQLIAARGGARHRVVGRLWVLAMAVTAISSFGITGKLGWAWLGGYSWIHGLSLWILVCLVLAVRAARRRAFPAHRGWMTGAYGGLVSAGVFAALDPGRVVGHWLFVTVPTWLAS